MKRQHGKRVLITGAASGIGLATAQRFFEEGASLLLNDTAPLEETELRERFKEAMRYVRGDISAAETTALLEEAARDGGVHVVINNAGITRDATALKLQDDAWDRVLAVNLTAVFRVCRMAGTLMKEQGSGGVILNAASVVAHYGNFGQSNYVASKAGVIALTKTLARELARYRVRVNAVAPGFVETEMTKKVPEKVLSAMRDKTPLGRLADPREIAAAYAFLASEEASYITGTCLNVDGGLVIG